MQMSEPLPDLAPLASCPIAARRSSVGVYVALGVILVLAAVLRFRGLAHESLWFDEALTVIHVRKSFTGMLASAHMLENMPPFYFCLLWVWARVFGTSDFAVRLPSAILGVAAVGMLFRVGRELVGRGVDGDRVGLMAALLLAISRHQIGYSQQARAYALMMFLLLVSCDCFLRLIGFGGGGPARRGTAVVYVLCSAMMLWTQPFSGFSLLGQDLFFGVLWLRAALVSRRNPHLDARNHPHPSPLPEYGERGPESTRLVPTAPAVPMREWLTYQGMILILFGPWLFHMREVMEIGAPWMHTPHIAAAYAEYADHWRPLVAAMGVLVALGIARGIWRRQMWVVFAVLLATLPVVIPVWASTPRHILFIPRYGMPAIIGICLLMAGGASMLGSIGGWVAVAVLCAIALPHVVDDFRQGRNFYPRPDVRSVAALVDSHAARGDEVVFEELLEQKVFSVYSGRGDLEISGQVPRTVVDSDTHALAPRRVWFVASSGNLDPHGGWIAGTPYRIVGEWRFNDAVVAELER